LTGFLRISGAELDNNPTERKAKTVGRHLDNSTKYLTEHGASIGDFYMSLIETCKLNNINPLEYLTFCITYRSRIADDPELFLPWNFLETKKEFEEELKNRPRYRIVSQHGAYLPKKQDLCAQQ
jgi:transposase